MKSNITYALRNIKNNVTNSIITVVGLAVAIACCLLVYFFVSQEYSFNQFHKNKDRIYRLNYERKFAGGSKWWDTRFEPQLIDIIKEKVPQVEMCTEYSHSWEQLMKYNDEFYDIAMSTTRQEFFSMFSFPFITGDPSTVFKNPDEIIITREYADILLGLDKKDYSSLMGKAVSFPLAYGEQLFRITGILENIPNNSGISFQGIIPGENEWNFGGCNNAYGHALLYYMLLEKANVKTAQENIHKVVLDYYRDKIESEKSANILSKTTDAFVPLSISMESSYFENDISNCYERTSNKRTLMILISIVGTILLIACSNYSILTLGQYMKKIGDIGIRKYMGAKRGHVFWLFLTEGFILTFISYLLGILLCTLLIPLFGQLAQYEIYSELINYVQAILFIAFSFLIIVIFTSLIPVFFFANINPRQISTKKLSGGKRSSLSQVFVSVQYCISIILIIVTIFIVKQSNYLKNKSLGINVNNIITIDNERLSDDERLLFKEMLVEHPGITSVTLTSRDFMNGSSDGYATNEAGEQIITNMFKVDEDYIKTLDLKLVKGRPFSMEHIKPNCDYMIVNEKFTEELLIKDDPIGKSFSIWGTDFTVLGVVKDYHYRDARSAIRPAMLFTRSNFGNSYMKSLVRFHPEQTSAVVDYIRECYKKLAPGKNLDYEFWDEKLGTRYEEEERWSKIIGYAAAIAIIISSLGLFGLTLLLINQRVKEIGVRKVNGATSGNVLISVLKSFIIWLIGSLLVAAPFAHMIVEKWLENFTYKIEISWWVFLLSGILTILIALFTVGYQSFKAANRNPVEALRYE